MEIKEAIKWLDDFVDYGYDWDGHREKELQEIKNLFEQGEKYKKMWEEFKYVSSHINVNVCIDSILGENLTDCVNDLFDKLEKKYLK